MAVLELKLNSVVNDGTIVSANVSLWARGTPTTSTILHDTVTRIPRVFLKTGTFTTESQTDITQLIKQKMLNFYNNLTTQQQSQITGICPEQS